MSRLRWLFVFVFVFVSLPCLLQAQAAVRASLDRDHATVGEPITLTISADGNAGKPDLSALGQDFTLGGVSSGSQTTIINGNVQSTQQWTVALIPRHAGAITIPTIAVGGERTLPLRVQVDAGAGGVGTAASPADVSSAATPVQGSIGKPGDPVFIESGVAQQHPYVGQAVVYTLRLYYAANLLDASLDAPTSDNGDLRQIGQDARGSQVVQGKTYAVVERRYLVQPEHSGSLHIGPTVFRGRAMGGSGNPFDDDMGIRALHASSAALSIDVRPQPSQATQPWLPAQAVTLSIDPPTSPPHAGEPFTLVAHETAQGAAASQLPEIALPAIPGAQVYPEPSTTTEQMAGDVLQAQRTRRFAIVPSRSGDLSLPALSLPWWNVTDDRAAIARVSLPRLQVLPGSAGASAAADAAAGAAPAVSAAAAPIATEVQQGLRAWQTATFVLAILLALALAWGWRRGGTAIDTAMRQVEPPAGTGGDAPSLREALASGVPSLIAMALCKAAPVPRPRHLHEVAERLADAAQRKAVLDFDAARWRGDGQPTVDVLAQLRSAFARTPRWMGNVPGANAATVLPPLYPD
ncbi:MAG: protein BatD [Proteobacteria bacterium]|nr:protein BatD [Pseudomonadota bacterium]